MSLAIRSLALFAAATLPLVGCETICKDEAKEAALAQAQAQAAQGKAAIDAAAAKDAALAANKALAARYFEEIGNQGKLEVADEIIAADYTYNDSTATTGPQAVKDMIGMYRTAFPDLKLEVLRQVAEGDMVVSHIRGTGTHQGDLMGLKPTGKTISATGIHIVKIANGKVAQEWEIVDQMTMMNQLQPAPAKKK